MGAANNTITKKEIVDQVSDRTNIKRSDVRIVLQEFLDEIIRELGNGRRLEFRDFGVFEVRQRAARTAQNPKTLEPVPVPAKNTVKFKPGRKMRDALTKTPGQGVELQDHRIAEVKVTDRAATGLAESPSKRPAKRREG